MVAETLTRGRLNVRIERVGRPEVKNMMLAPKQFDQVNRDLEIRDLYNMEDAFHLGEGYTGAYRARLDANLAFWDGLDGKVDWPVDETGATRSPSWCSTTSSSSTSASPTRSRARSSRSSWRACAGSRTGRAGAGPQRRRDGHHLHPARQRRRSVRRSATGSTAPPGPATHHFPYLAERRTRTRPSPPEHHH